MGMGNDMYIQCFGSGGREQKEQGQVEEEKKEHV